MASVLEPRTDSRRISCGDEPLYEVVDGLRVELPPMGILSNVVANLLNVIMFSHARNHGLGTVVVEALLILDEESDLRRRPDVAFVSAERWPLDREIPEVGDWAVIPDLALEVISPNDRFGEVNKKVREYFRYGVREVWVVEPEDRVVSVYASPTDVEIRTHEQSLETPLLPGLTIPLGEVFARRPSAVQ